MKSKQSRPQILAASQKHSGHAAGGSVFTHRSRENERKTQRLYIHRHNVLLQIAGPWLCSSHYLLLLLSAPDIKLHIGHVFFLQCHQHLSEGGSVVWMQLTSNLSLWEKPSHHHESSGRQSPDFNHPQDSRSQDLPAPIVFVLRITFSLLSSYDYIFKCLFVFLLIWISPSDRDLYSLEEK